MAKNIKRYNDLEKNGVIIEGFKICEDGKIENFNSKIAKDEQLIVSSDIIAKSILAMSKISLLMPYYGGMISEDEWEDYTTKYVIENFRGSIMTTVTFRTVHFLAFHTSDQRDRFLIYNKHLVEDFLMIKK